MQRNRVTSHREIARNATNPLVTLSGVRVTGMLSPAEQDVCLLREDDSDQSAYPYSLPMIDGGNGDLEDLVGLLRQERDTEALEAFKRDNLDTDATTVQHPRTTFRPDVEIEPPEEVPINSESPTSVGIQKAEGKFAVRDVKELVADAGHRRRSGSTDERCRWNSSGSGISRKDRETVEKQAWFQ